MFVIILHITQKRSRLIAIIPFAGVSLMYDIMNPIGFILEVPAELRMRRKQRKKDDIMNLDRFILCAENSADTESHLRQIMDSAKRGKNDKRTDT